MRRTFATLVSLVSLAATLPALLPTSAQVPDPPAPPADPAQALKELDKIVGQTVPPALAQAYQALGQNITREDVRIFLDLNVTKGDVNVLGLVLGSGRMELQAKVRAHLELRVISSERIRSLVAGDNAYNITARNTTTFSKVFIPAEVFRASLTAETLAAFQKEEEAAVAGLIARAMPELDLLGLEFRWSHVHPYEATSDPSLTEPPITLDVDAVVQHVRVESIPSLTSAYFGAKKADDGKSAYVRQLKADAGDPLRSRDFFAAAAYTQLLNLSIQPGWLLKVNLNLPRGYSFTYFNDAVQVSSSRRHAEFGVDATGSDQEERTVVLASLTHKRAVALALFVGLWIVGPLIVVLPRILYSRTRLRKLRSRTTDSTARRGKPPLPPPPPAAATAPGGWGPAVGNRPPPKG